ncbi:hypothetical protein BX666DRAFT_1880095 [Dichotomocladium elegans]|nr:hypothetical protein BX666DRAFT_1880095 [Dichotomocladium elegans]
MSSMHQQDQFTAAERTLGEIFPAIHPEVISQVLASVHHNTKDAHDILLSMSCSDQAYAWTHHLNKAAGGTTCNIENLKAQVLDHVKYRMDAKMCKWASKQERKEQKRAEKELRRSIKRDRKYGPCCSFSSVGFRTPQVHNEQRCPGLVGGLVGLGVGGLLIKIPYFYTLKESRDIKLDSLVATKKAIVATNSLLSADERQEEHRIPDSSAAGQDLPSAPPPPYDSIQNTNDTLSKGLHSSMRKK